ncbi:MAG TPA: PAS domain S-box protein, partial [Anaerolineaceae bacterium]|nr:PAS domain S-box protein [Anaerolineaceae bacterium]
MSDPIRVLLVDDDEDEYILLREIFNDLSIEIGNAHYLLEWVNNTETAIQIIPEQNFDVILIDYRLGDQNGLELFQKLVSQGISTPAILLTGQGSYDLDLRAMQEGFAEYLVKDQITPLLLERSIRYTIERKQVQIELERRVEERTHDLQVLNQALQAEIERREQTQQALQTSEEKFRVLAESTSAAIFIITEGRIRYANPAVRFILGYSPEELMAMDLEEIVHPNYRWTVKLNREQPPNNGLPMRYEIKVITKQHEERWLDVTVGDIAIEGQHAWMVTAFDITERDLAERELKKAKDELEVRVTERTAELVAANSRLQTVLNTMPLAIWIADADGNIIQSNRMVEAIWGKEAPAASSLNDFSRYRGWRTDTKEPLQLEDWALVRAIFKGETSISEMIDIQRFDGQMATVLTSSAPILDPEGQLVGAVAVSQDITEIRRREEHTQRSAQRSGLIARVQQAIAEAGLDIQKILSATSGEIATSTGNKVFIWLVSEE